jgi:hypothetical protein
VAQLLIDDFNRRFNNSLGVPTWTIEMLNDSICNAGANLGRSAPSSDWLWPADASNGVCEQALP